MKVNNNISSNRLHSHSLKLVTKHSYHLIDPSLWPLISSSSVFMITVGLVSWMMHNFLGGWTLILNGIFLVLYIVAIWWRDVIREATFEEQHKITVRKGLRFGIILFIVSEIMFFFAFFLAFFYSSLSTVFNVKRIWQPKSVLNYCKKNLKEIVGGLLAGFKTRFYSYR